MFDTPPASLIPLPHPSFRSIPNEPGLIECPPHDVLHDPLVPITFADEDPGPLEPVR